MEKLATLALAGISSVFVLLALKVSVIAFNLAFYHARPAFFRRVHGAYVDRPGRSIAVGIANTVVMLFLSLILLQIKPLALLGLLLAALLCAIHLWGRTAYYQVLEDRLNAGFEAAPSRCTWLRGALVAELGFLVPVLGQLLFIGITLRCAGAFIIALLSRPANRAEEVGE